MNSSSTLKWTSHPKYSETVFLGEVYLVDSCGRLGFLSHFSFWSRLGAVVLEGFEGDDRMWQQQYIELCKDCRSEWQAYGCWLSPVSRVKAWLLPIDSDGRAQFTIQSDQTKRPQTCQTLAKNKSVFAAFRLEERPIAALEQAKLVMWRMVHGPKLEDIHKRWHAVCQVCAALAKLTWQCVKTLYPWWTSK